MPITIEGKSMHPEVFINNVVFLTKLWVDILGHRENCTWFILVLDYNYFLNNMLPNESGESMVLFLILAT